MTSFVNTQPHETISKDPDGFLEVVDVWETIQGEGPFAGEPSIFVRLAGCNLQCPLCDTDYTSKRERFSPADLFAKVKSIRKSGLIVITGGEPFRQNIAPFVRQVLHFFVSGWVMPYHIQIETNGTYDPGSGAWGSLPRRDQDCMIVCSPKSKIHPNAHKYIGAYKYVVEAGQISEEDGLPLKTLGGEYLVGRPVNNVLAPIYVQPLDEQDEIKNKEHLDAAVQSCLKFGYKLTIQMHKIIGLR